MTKDEFLTIRQTLRMSQIEMGLLLDLERQQIARYEHGTTPIPVLVERELRRLVAHYSEEAQP